MMWITVEKNNKWYVAAETYGYNGDREKLTEDAIRAIEEGYDCGKVSQPPAKNGSGRYEREVFFFISGPYANKPEKPLKASRHDEYTDEFCDECGRSIKESNDRTNHCSSCGL